MAYVHIKFDHIFKLNDFCVTYTVSTIYTEFAYRCLKSYTVKEILTIMSMPSFLIAGHSLHNIF